MPPVSNRQRIARILLDSDKPLTAEQILANWTASRVPTRGTVSMLLSSHKEYIAVKSPKGKPISYTHIDHRMLASGEEE
jgi:hypothetical protein